MKNVKKLFAVLGQWKFHYGASALLLILSTFIRSIEPKIVQIAIDGTIIFFQSKGKTEPTASDSITQFLYNMLPDLHTADLVWMLACIGLLYLGISLIRGTAMFGSRTIAAFCTEKAIKQLRDNLFNHIQKLPLQFHTKLSRGEMIQRCTGDVDTVKNFIGGQVVDLILLFAIFFSAFFMMATVHLTYALLAVCIAPIIFLLSILFFKKEQKVWQAHEDEQDKLTSIVEENLAGIRVTKAFATEKQEIEKFGKQNKATRKIAIQHVNLHALYWPVSDMLFHIQVTLSIFAGGYFALHNQITVGELVAFYTYIIMVSWPMRRIGRVLSQMSMALVAVKRLANILDAETEEYNTTQPSTDPLQGAVTFQNVWFKYKEEEDFVLQDVSFTVEAGETVALVGTTGAGKSTTIALLSRFYEPNQGTILLDGKPLEEYDKTYVRNRIGVVLQKSFLFSTTIKNNISYANPTASEEEIITSAKAASIHHIMDDVFPQGYDTVVGEKGVTLSGGQKQRVTLARTLLEKPDILVLDDATSAVDTETEYNIQQALQTHMDNKTTFIIAHRITAVQGADKIIVLDKGKVTNVGSHEQLIKEAGFYKEIYQVQAAIEEDWVA